MQKISEVRGQMEDNELHRISKEEVEMSRKEGTGKDKCRGGIVDILDKGC